jgi:hypothetical protein
VGVPSAEEASVVLLTLCVRTQKREAFGPAQRHGIAVALSEAAELVRQHGTHPCLCTAATVFALGKQAHAFGEHGEVFVFLLSRRTLAEDGLEPTYDASALRGEFIRATQREVSLGELLEWIDKHTRPAAGTHSHSRVVGPTEPEQEAG